MTANADPWKTLGLAPGAGIEEIRRAYRRLAKVNHPDAAGESALPRFLAIQAAYEQLVGPECASPARQPPGTVDHDAARALAGGSGPGPAPPAAPTAGVPAPGRPAGPARAGPGGRRHGIGIGSRQRAGRDVDRHAPAEPGVPPARPAPRRGRRRRIGPVAPAVGQTSSPEQGDAVLDLVRPGRRGAVRARLERGQLVRLVERHLLDDQPEGVRRPAQARSGVPAAGAARRESAGSSTTTHPAGRTAPSPSPHRPEPPPGRLRPRRPGRTQPPGLGTEDRRAAADAGMRRASRRAPRPAAAAMGDVPPPPAAHRPNPRDWFEAPPPDRRFRGRSSAGRRPASAGSRWRSWRWPPLALVTTVAIGEETGCGRFAASCGEVSSPGTWIVLAAIFLLLLALPRVAAWLAHGTLATAVIGIPTAIVLSAGGGSRVPEASAAFLHGRPRDRLGRRGRLRPDRAAPGRIRRALGCPPLTRAANRPDHARPPRTMASMSRRHDANDLSNAAQEYLLALRVMAGDGSHVRAAQVGRHLGVSTQAASEMFRRLVADGLVRQADGRDLVLTAAGRAAADAIFRRHALLEWLLTSVVGLGWAESDEEAARLQGALSPRVEARLDEMLGHPPTCPHGNPIDAETARQRPKGTPLSEIEGGQRATIYRITEEAEEDAGLLSYLEARALTPGRRDHGPRPLRVARLADARGPARPGDARACGRRRSSTSCRATPTRRCSTGCPAR